MAGSQIISQEVKGQNSLQMRGILLKGAFPVSIQISQKPYFWHTDYRCELTPAG